MNSRTIEARSSVGERYIDTVEVDSSILSVPTIFAGVTFEYCWNRILELHGMFIFVFKMVGSLSIVLASDTARRIETLTGFNTFSSMAIS